MAQRRGAKPNLKIAKRYALRLSGHIERIDGKAVTHCNELPIAGFGDTPEGAMRSFFECLTAYLGTFEREGKLEGVLKEHGALIHETTPPQSNFFLDLPYTTVPQERVSALV